MWNSLLWEEQYADSFRLCYVKELEASSSTLYQVHSNLVNVFKSVGKKWLNHPRVWKHPTAQLESPGHHRLHQLYAQYYKEGQ
jgi:hypothetical protein